MLTQDDSPESPPPSLRAGEELGRYLIRTRLAVGPRGEVFLAYDPRASRLVSLRLLPPVRAGVDARELPAEARALAGLRHPNLLPILEAGVVAGRAFVAQEYLEEQTLQQWLQESPRGWREVVAVLLQVGRGLAAAHAAGVVHRDLHPGCVLVGPQGQVRLKDFSLAAPGGPPAPPQALASASQPLALAPGWQGGVGGAPGYLAPEQLRWQPADERSDQFSYCVLLYQALYGQSPFGGQSLQDSWGRLLSGDVPQQPTGQGVPGWVRAVVRRGLAYRPSQRFASMRQLLRHLGRQPVRGRRLYASLAAGLVLAAAGAGGWWRLSPRRSCGPPEQQWVGVWDEARKQALRQTFQSTGQPSADAAWRSVEQELERYLGKWAESRQEACEATRGRGEQSEAVLELRLRCLARRLKEVGALVEVLQGVQRTELVQARLAPGNLTPLEVCSNLKDLTIQEHLPEEPSLRARVEELQERLVWTRALYSMGRYNQGLEQAQALVEAAEATGFQPLMGEAWLLLARVQGFTPAEPKAVLQSTHRSAQAFLASGQLQGVARAWIRVVSAHHRQGKPAAEELERWIQYLEASVRAVGDPPPLRNYYENTLAFVRTQQGRYAEGLAHAQTAVALAERIYGPRSEHLASALQEVARAAPYNGETEKAMAASRRALAIGMGNLGLEHPNTLRTLNQLGKLQADEGLYAEAAATFEQVLAIQQRLDIPENIDRVVTLNNLASIYIEQERYTESAHLIERNLNLIARLEAQETSNHVVALLSLSELKSQQGEDAEALRVARKAFALAERLLAPTKNVYISALTVLGSAELAVGETSQAILHLERAVKLIEEGTALPQQLGSARFALARALQTAGKQLPRSRALLEQAGRDFDKAGRQCARERAAWEAWVTERKLELPRR